ncbi:PAS-domain containing protein [Roseibium sp.]|uniref:PAS domain-containing sensor histidine kinase n=1 Tax=Roseibium sp. TaxID=1936156 RepID=UPI003A96A399
MPVIGLNGARNGATWRRWIRQALTLTAACAAIVTGLGGQAMAATATSTDGFSFSSFSIDAVAMAWLGLFGGVCAFAVVSALAFLRQSRKTSMALRKLGRQNAGLNLSLDRLETILNTDEQRVIVWTGNGETPQIWGVLPEESGVPKAPSRLLAFGSWLTSRYAADLERNLDKLFTSGEAFCCTLKTSLGSYVEAAGRTTGGAVVLRLRDLTGERRMQAELAARNARISGELHMLHALLNAMPAPAWQSDAEGTLIWANRAYAQAVDAPDTATTVREAMDFMDATGRTAMERDRNEDGCFRARLPLVAAGERRVFDVTDVSANVGSAGLAIDISELEQVRKELNRAQEFHGRTLDQLATAVAIYGSDRRLQFYNAAYRQLWDLEPGFLEAKPEDGAILDALRTARKIPEQVDYRVWRKNMLEAYQSLEARESWWHLPDGRTLRVIANPNPHGGVTYIYENVTEQLDLESRYNALTRVQGETLDNLSEAVAVFGSDGRLRLWNPAFGRIWGLREEQLETVPHINQVVDSCALVEDERVAWEELVSNVTGLLDNRTQAVGRMERHDGAVLDYATVPLPDGGTLVTFVDVTDSVNVERALLEKNEALEEADQLKNAFIQHVSYELRSPLTNIIGFAQLLTNPKFGDLSVKQDEYANYILTSSSALLAIINDILDLATIDAGIMELEAAEVDVAATVAAAAEGLKDRLEDARISLNTHVPDDIGTIVADEKRLRQVLFNLIANAIRYSEENGVVDVSCNRGDDEVVFEVKDHGLGIPAEILSQVFNRFVGHDAGNKRQGAGLGLSIVKSFVELHGGHVDIDSSEGNGTTVICTFPARPKATGTLAAE